MAQYEGYCMKCREKRTFEGQIVTLKNGRPAAQGACPVCGTHHHRDGNASNNLAAQAAKTQRPVRPPSQPVEKESADGVNLVDHVKLPSMKQEASRAGARKPGTSGAKARKAGPLPIHTPMW